MSDRNYTIWKNLCERDVVIKGSVDKNIYFDFTVLCIIFLIILCTVRRGSASVDVLAGAKRSCGVRNSGGKLDWYSSTGM